jgi:hypothetical protein
VTTPTRRAVRSARHLISGRVFAQAARGAYVLVLARSLEAASYGALAFAQVSYLVYLPFVALGTREVARRYGLAAGAAASGVVAWLTASSGVLLVRDVEVMLWAVAAGMAIWVAVLAARLQADWNVRALQLVVAPLMVIGTGWAGYVVLERFHRVAASASLATAAILLPAGVTRTSPADVRPIGVAQRLTGES